MQMKSRASVPVLIALFGGTIAFVIPATTANAQVAATGESSLALMPLPSSITRGDGALTVTPAGGGASTFTYRYDQTHDESRTEAPQ